MASHTYYDVLGVSSSSEPEVIDAAYRALMQKYHPDRTRGDISAAHRAQEITEAYATLKDPEKRRRYDLERIGKGQLALHSTASTETQGSDVSAVSQSAVDDNELRRCPHCAEKIQVSARICRFCGLATTGSAEPRDFSPTQTNIYNQINTPHARALPDRSAPGWTRSCLILALVLSLGVFFLFATGFWTAEITEATLPLENSALGPPQFDTDAFEGTPAQEYASPEVEIVPVDRENPTIDVPQIATIDPSRANQVAITPDWLAGAWLRDGDGSCPGDIGETFRPDGRWSTWSEQGSWALSGNELVIRATHSTGVESPSRQPEPLTTSSGVRGFIQEANENSFTWLTTRDEKVSFYRCIDTAE